MTLDDFYALPRLSTFFPLVYKDGAKWNKLTADCRDCNVQIDDRDVRGDVRQPFPDIFIIDAKGYCQWCRRLSRIEYRLLGDRSMVGQDLKTGEWLRWEAQAMWTWRARLRRWRRKMDNVARLVAG